VPRNTSNQLVLFAMGHYPLQMQWLQHTINYRDNRVANKARSDLLNFILTAGASESIKAGCMIMIAGQSS
jgi:hypothetical protein